MNMAIDAKALGLHRLTVEERLELLDLVLASLEADAAAPDLSREQTAELERRVADADANPDDAVSWQDLKTEALLRLRQ
jgi:putative addiction module component (TIGR02574 family)